MTEPSEPPPDPFRFLSPPPRGLMAVVAVPAKDEAEGLPRLVAALAAQRTRTGRPLGPGRLEALVLLNNTTDGSAQALRAAARAHPGLDLHVAHVTLPPARAHVGWARKLAMDAACARLLAAGNPRGLVLTTDADTRPAPTWVDACRREVRSGADGVGGRVLLDPQDRAALPPAVRRAFLLDIGYRRALEAVRALYAPDPSDPAPRHHQHFGASLALTARAYAQAGGTPPERSSEDVALYRALLASGGRFRHSYAAQVFTSARRVGRASGGLADALQSWEEGAREGRPLLAESAEATQRRLAWLGLWRAANLGLPDPPALVVTPTPPDNALPGEAFGPIEQVLAGLRVRAERLARLSLAERLAEARARWGDPPSEPLAARPVRSAPSPAEP